MKKDLLRFALLLSCLQLLFSCSPDDQEYIDNDIVDMNSITAIKLKPNHNKILADGKATLELHPVLYKGTAEVVHHRVEDSWLEYYTLSGIKAERYFTTTDRNLYGLTLKVYAKLKDKNIYSDTVAFTVLEPLDLNLKEITIPIVFHIIQTTEDVVSYGGEFGQDRVELIVSRLNNAFSGMVAAPVGVDTKIRFKLAVYAPDGSKLNEAGINRVEVENISTDNNYADFLRQQKLIWDPGKYMNIWLISDGDNKVTNFGYDISNNCKPRYMKPGAEQIPEGSNLTELAGEKNWESNEAGLLYKLQLFNLPGFVQGRKENNDFNFYVGTYLGLLPTWGYVLWGSTVKAQDYCGDTQKYVVDSENATKNTGWEKKNEEYEFTAENIMDDQISLHRSVSREQCLRMRWVLENCPERAAWKSDFAFIGK